MISFGSTVTGWKYRDRLGADVIALQEVNGPKAAALVFPPDQ